MTDNSGVNIFNDFMRSMFTILNMGVYTVLAYMYRIFFNVAEAQLFEDATIRNMYSRIQLIIGVFMIFKLVVSVLQGIVDPNKFTDSKNGIGNVITRIIVALAMLTLLVPISIPNPTNSYEKYINNNGILFGTLYSLQDRILKNNTLGFLILNVKNDGTTKNAEDREEELKNSANMFSSTVLKTFFRVNLIPEEGRDDDDETNSDNWYCQDSDSHKFIQLYQQLDIAPSTLLNMSNASCELNDGFLSTIGNKIGGAIDYMIGWVPIVGDAVDTATDAVQTQRYVFVFHGFLALIIGIVFLVMLIGFCVDIAIRSIKLSILRLLAPIPIISYIDPKTTSSFNSWLKTLGTTYLDLFLRLLIVYFVIFIIQEMMVNGIIINEASGMVGILSLVFIWIGLFFFAKEAPKFIKQTLGLKDGNFKLFGGLGKLAGAATLAAGGIGSGISNARNYYADNAKDKEGHDVNTGRRILGSMGSGIAGVASGLYTGGKAMMSSDKDYSKNAREAMLRRNANYESFGDKVSGSMMNMREILGLKQPTEKYEDFVKHADNVEKLLDSLVGKGKSFGGTVTTADNSKLTYTNLTSDLSGKSKDLLAAGDAAHARGDATFDYNGQTIDTRDYKDVAFFMGKSEQEGIYDVATKNGPLSQAERDFMKSNSDFSGAVRDLREASKSLSSIKYVGSRGEEVDVAINIDSVKNLGDTKKGVATGVGQIKNSSAYKSSQKK